MLTLEEKYANALRDLPAPGSGAGCHSGLLGIANYGVRLALEPEKILDDIRRNLKKGTRIVSDREIMDAIRRAEHDFNPNGIVKIDMDAPLDLRDESLSNYDSYVYIPEPELNRKEITFIDPRFVEATALPTTDKPAYQQIIDYLEALFHPEELVSHCFHSFQIGDSDKYVPADKGIAENVGETIARLRNKQSVNTGFGAPDHEEAGAWIRINPVSNNEGKDTSVSSFRHALVECDNLPIEKQYALIKELQLPCAAIVHSGGKSVHAIVKVEASTAEEYKERVIYLQKVCESNGLTLDKQNCNASRYSRMPGVKRGEKQQYLIETNCGQYNWDAWKDYISERNDNLPNFDEFDSSEPRPELAPAIIDGILRQRHKMLVSGPSKAGKSFLLLELAIAMATGGEWLGWKCHQGKVLYVNLELDKPSCLNRIYDLIGDKIKIAKGCLDVWNLRGYAEPLSTLANKIIRRGKDKGYLAVIIDPIYKVITGDENAADQMAKFCNYFDLISKTLNCAMIYCHHHSKGEQGAKMAQDRASGSGVFARDPDAMLDMIELKVTPDRRKELIEKYCIKALQFSLSKVCDLDVILQKDKQENYEELTRIAGEKLGTKETERIINEINDKLENATAWRIEGILREFAGFQPLRSLFVFPRHVIDTTNTLAKCAALGENLPLEAVEEIKERKKAQKKQEQEQKRLEKEQRRQEEEEKRKQERKQDRQDLLHEIYLAWEQARKPVTVATIALTIGIHSATLYRHLKAIPQLKLQNGYVVENEENE